MARYDTSDDCGIMAKSLKLLRQIAPKTTRLGMLVNLRTAVAIGLPIRSRFRYGLSQHDARSLRITRAGFGALPVFAN